MNLLDPTLYTVHRSYLDIADDLIEEIETGTPSLWLERQTEWHDGQLSQDFIELKTVSHTITIASVKDLLFEAPNRYAIQLDECELANVHELQSLQSLLTVAGELTEQLAEQLEKATPPERPKDPSKWLDLHTGVEYEKG